MNFQEPLWLVAAALVAVAGAAGLRLAEAKRSRDLARFVAAPLLGTLAASSSPQRRVARGALLIGAVALGCVALARPTFGFHWEETRRRGTDVVFALDVSRSMLAGDVKPDRLTRAKLGMIDLLEKLGGDRVGLVAFAGSAFLQAPLTSDHRAFREALDALDPSVIPRGGTDLGAALHEAEAAFRTAPGAQKIVVLVTDGEDLEGNARTAAEQAAKRGITVYTVGVGTPAGETISLARAGGRGVVTDEHGEPVVSRLDEQGLREVAEKTGGFYVPLGARGEGLVTLQEQVLSKAPQQEHSERSQRVPVDRYQWPLGLALAAAVGEALLSERRRRVAGSRPLRVASAAAASVLALVLMAGPARASSREAEQAYASGDYEAARAYWRAAAEERPQDARLHFNEGVAAYRAGKAEEAAAAFGRALETGDVALQQRAWYDLGNARFRMAESAAKEDPEAAKRTLEEAIAAYDGALSLDGRDEDARFNRDVAKQRLAALEQPQQQPPQQSPQSQQKQDEPSQPQSPSQQEQPPQPQPSPGEAGQAQPSPGTALPSQPKGDEGAQPGGDEAPQPGGDEAPQPRGDEAPQPGGDEGAQPKGEGASRPAAGVPPQAGTGATPPGQPEPRAGQPPAEPPPERDAQKLPQGALPERADGEQEGSAPAAGAVAGGAGQMSAADAGQLLDSLRGEDAQAPRTASGRGASGSENDEPIRNW